MVKQLMPVVFIGMFIFFNACQSDSAIDNRSIATDSLSIANGASLFNKNCSGCHNFLQNGIGPSLNGLTTKVSAKWIARFISNPQELFKSGDERATGLAKNNSLIMPSFTGLDEKQLNEIISFLHTYKQEITADENDNSIKNPIPDTIQRSNLAVTLQQITQAPASSDSGKLPLTRITKLEYQPGTGTLFLLDLRGKLYRLNGFEPEVYFDMVALNPNFEIGDGLATGFGSFAFHPNFATNGLIYTVHTEPAGTAKATVGYTDSIKAAIQCVLTEWKADDPRAKTFKGIRRELMRINMVSIIHGMQEVTFRPNSKPGDEDHLLLYLGIGDGGCVENGHPFLAHSINSLYGTVIRIDPSGKSSVNGNYGIPQSNPFSTNKLARGEIYAYGFRNPHRITWTSRGDMLVSNIGQKNIESVNLIKKGNDYGWPIREGRFLLNPLNDIGKVYKLPANDSTYHIIYPVVQFDHDEGKAITGGFEYTGNNIPALKGKFLFGDIPSGRLFYVSTNELKLGQQATIKEWSILLNDKKQTLKALCGSDRVDLHFGQDAKGELYILTKADGRLYKLTGASN
ncbi:MAG: PQQ-dependent sugar dehydrogenase [Chitinophagaceae bacterium]